VRGGLVWGAGGGLTVRKYQYCVQITMCTYIEVYMKIIYKCSVTVEGLDLV